MFRIRISFRSYSLVARQTPTTNNRIQRFSDLNFKQNKGRKNQTTNVNQVLKVQLKNVFVQKSKDLQDSKQLNREQLKVNLELMQKKDEQLKLQRKQNKKIQLTFWQKIKNVVKHAVHETISGAKKCRQDYQFTKRLLFNKNIQNKQDLNVFEVHNVKRIKFDLLKLIPFSVFLLIPLTEVLIPPYILLFPNAFPTQFIPKDFQAQKKRILQEKQEKAHIQLMYQLKSSLIANGISLSLIKDQNELYNQVIKNKDFIDRYLQLDKLESDTLLLICDYMNLQVISGTHILNTIYSYIVNLPKHCINLVYMLLRSKQRVEFKHWIFNYQIKMNFWYFETMKQRFLLQQIEKYLISDNCRNIKQLRDEDHAIAKFGIPMESKYEAGILEIGQSRGFTTKDTEDLKEILEGYWISNITSVNLTNTQYVWFAVLNRNVDVNFKKYI